MNSISTIILTISLMVIMLGMGLSLQLGDFKRILLHPKAIIVGLINQILILPLLGFCVASVTRVTPEIAVGIMILAACPGGQTSNLITHLAKGDTALSVSLTAIGSFITIITIPFIVNFGLVQFMNHGQIVKLDVSQTILQTTAIIVVPICIGMLIRIKNKKFANTMSGPVRKASVIILVLVIIVLVSNEKNNVVHYFEQAGLAAMLLNVISMLVGYFSAKLFKISDYRSLSIAIESGNQNGTMAIAIAVVLLGNTSFAIAPAIYSLLMFITGGMVISLGIEIYKIRLIKDSRSAS